MVSKEHIDKPTWFYQQYEKIAEFLQPTKTTLMSIPLAVYGYATIFLMILIALEGSVRVLKLRGPCEKCTFLL